MRYAYGRRSQINRAKNCVSMVCFVIMSILSASVAVAASESASETAGTLDQVQPKMVKIYGAGGFRGLEAYQSGMLISPEGHILTAYSHVLDTDYITVYLADGRKFEAKLLGADPRLEVAVLKIDAADLPYFDLDRAAKAEDGLECAGAEQSFQRGRATSRQACSTALSRRLPSWRPGAGRSKRLIAARSTCST